MPSVTATSQPDVPATGHREAYPRFLARLLWEAFDGTWRFYVWMILLTAVFLVGANAWAVQVRDGTRALLTA